MLKQADRKRYEKWLLALTSLPTAAGREQAVIDYLTAWTKPRRSLAMTRDAYGNVIIARKAPRKASRKTPRKVPRKMAAAPIYIQAHMDHPAFVVHEVLGPRTLLAEFRGGVDTQYFAGTPVLAHTQRKIVRGKVVRFEDRPRRTDPMIDDSAKILRVEFKQEVQASKGDILTWDTGKAKIARGRLHAPACDDLAALAAALAAYDQWLALPAARRKNADVRLLFTRAEEIGFIGTIAACKAGSIEKDARLICLENSKSFPESPIGGGPIVRVGDRTSTFDPDLTFRCARIAMDLQKDEPAFRFQRKLMPGGTCEASAYQAFGHIATCLCLALGNYHNMNETTGKIDAEIISTDDYHGLVRLLLAIVTRLDDPIASPSLHARLEELFAHRKNVLNE